MLLRAEADILIQKNIKKSSEGGQQINFAAV